MKTVNCFYNAILIFVAELVGSIPSNILGEIIVDYVNRLVLSCKRCWAFLLSVMEYLVLVFNVFFRRAEVVAREDFVNIKGFSLHAGR